MTRTLGNIVIVLVLAALVVAVPGAGAGASVIRQVVSLVFLGAMGWFASLMYRQHRVDLYSLGDRRRAIVYVALGVAALTLSATSRMWDSSAGSVAWLLLIGACIYALIAVFVSARRA